VSVQGLSQQLWGSLGLLKVITGISNNALGSKHCPNLQVLKGTGQRQVDKYAVAEHSINTGHCIDFSNTIVLDRMSSYMDHLVEEAIGIRLNNQNFNRDGGLMLSHAWHPVINMLSNQ
jgi:hypothetical protein